MASNVASWWIGTATGDTPLGVVNPSGFVGASSPAAKYGFGLRAANNLADKIVFGTDNTDGFIQTFGGVLHLNTQGQNVVVGNATPITFTPQGAVIPQLYQTGSNCSSSAAPAVCGSAAAGSVVIAAAGTTVTVNTTAVTANSQIFLNADDTLSTKLAVTCNSTLATLVGGLAVTARTAGTSFQITSGTTPAVNPLCISYHIIN